MNEAETIADHIDPALVAAGWGDVEGSRIRREYLIAPGWLESFGRRGKSLTADYLLLTSRAAVRQADSLTPNWGRVGDLMLRALVPVSSAILRELSNLPWPTSIPTARRIVRPGVPTASSGGWWSG